MFAASDVRVGDTTVALIKSIDFQSDTLYSSRGAAQAVLAAVTAVHRARQQPITRGTEV
jgi:hypothetical protein